VGDQGGDDVVGFGGVDLDPVDVALGQRFLDMGIARIGLSALSSRTRLAL